MENTQTNLLSLFRSYVFKEKNDNRIEYFIEFEQFLIANYLNCGYKDDLGVPYGSP